MGDLVDVVFLGVNEAGMRVYDWLCAREEVFVHSLLTTKEQLRVIEEVKPDYIVSCGYRHIVPEDILEVPKEAALNLHPAYLPYNRGANPNVWSIVEGTPAGVSLHIMDSNVDTGKVIARREVEVSFGDTGRDLHRRLENAQFDLFTETWPDIVAGDATATEQERAAGTYHRTNDFEELCRLDPDERVRVKDLLDRLRALTFPPYDNAEIEVEGEKYYIEVDISKK